MKRTDLLPRKTYISIPISLATSPAYTATAKLLWMWLAYRLGDNETTWWTEEHLAEHLSLSRSTISRAVLALEAGGWLHCNRRSDDSTEYTLLIGRVDGPKRGARRTKGAQDLEHPAQDLEHPLHQKDARRSIKKKQATTQKDAEACTKLTHKTTKGNTKQNYERENTKLSAATPLSVPIGPDFCGAMHSTPQIQNSLGMHPASLDFLAELDRASTVPSGEEAAPDALHDDDNDWDGGVDAEHLDDAA